MKRKDTTSILNNLAIFTHVKGSLDGFASYADFAREVFNKTGGNLTKYLCDVVLDSSNPHLDRICQSKHVPKCLKERTYCELELIQVILDNGYQPLTNYFEERNVDLCAKLSIEKVDIKKLYDKQIKHLSTKGFGIYKHSKMLEIDRSGNLRAVSNPDTIKLSDLFDYELERKQVLDNTIFFLDGANAQNVLLTGDAGTGKSSTIKAIANEFAHRGLRIVQITKEQISLIPKIEEELSKIPLKFILFIDDISLSTEDENFSEAKRLLEGTLCAQPDNILIYATSNRRHIVREKFADRDGDDIHVGDAIAEMVSLSERFGLRVNFSRPSKEAYLNIVRNLSEFADVQIDESTLVDKAEQYALYNGGRSCRLAKQFVDQISNS